MFFIYKAIVLIIVGSVCLGMIATLVSKKVRTKILQVDDNNKIDLCWFSRKNLKRMNEGVDDIGQAFEIVFELTGAIFLFLAITMILAMMWPVLAVIGTVVGITYLTFKKK